MFKNEENLLSNLKAEYDTIEIPMQLDGAIWNGIQKPPAKHKLSHYVRLAGVSAAVLLLLLGVTARLSPVFADYLMDVPILKYIVKLVNYDQGLKAAVENNFIQNIGVSDEHGGIRFTVDSMIADESRVIVFYTLENNSQHKGLHMRDIEFTDENHQGVKAAFMYGFLPTEADKVKIQDNIKMSFVPGTEIPSAVHLSFKLCENNSATDTEPQYLPYLWQVDIPIDKSKFENLTQVYPVNKTIEIGGQKITVDKTTISPTRISVEVSYSEDNTMRIFNFANVKLVNEKGEVLSGLMNDMSGSFPSDNQLIMYFESNYFKASQQLYLSFEDVRAVDKDKTFMVVDAHKEQLLQVPDQNVRLSEITGTGKETTINFLYEDTFSTDKMQYQCLSISKIMDHAGKELNITASGHSFAASHPLDKCYSITFENGGGYEEPLKLLLEDYPKRVEGTATVQLK